MCLRCYVIIRFFLPRAQLSSVSPFFPSSTSSSLSLLSLSLSSHTHTQKEKKKKNNEDTTEGNKRNRSSQKQRQKHRHTGKAPEGKQEEGEEEDGRAKKKERQQQRRRGRNKKKDKKNKDMRTSGKKAVPFPSFWCAKTYSSCSSTFFSVWLLAHCNSIFQNTISEHLTTSQTVLSTQPEGVVDASQATLSVLGTHSGPKHTTSPTF